MDDTKEFLKEIGIEETMLTAWNWQLQLRKKGIM